MMGQICSFCASICCCLKRKPLKTKHKTRDYKSWKEEESITPSEIPDSELTEEFKVPNSRFATIAELFEEKGYDFKNKEDLGKGAFGNVFKICKDGQTFALKEISLKSDHTRRDRKQFKKLKNEIFIIYKIKHKNIIQMIDHFIVNNNCYLVLEFANSGTVEQEVHRSEPMSEMKAKTYFIQIVKAIEHLHLHKPAIAHNDLKLANILIHIENKEKIIKVTDFGLSQVLSTKSDEKIYRASVAEGTKIYMSPQMLLLITHTDIIESKDKEELKQLGMKVKDVNPIKADIWSLGVCLYYMISGEFPFDLNIRHYSATIKEQVNRVIKPIDKEISRQLIDILNRMLEPNTIKRITISEIVKHHWLSGVSDVLTLDERYSS